MLLGIQSAFYDIDLAYTMYRPCSLHFTVKPTTGLYRKTLNYVGYIDFFSCLLVDGKVQW